MTLAGIFITRRKQVIAVVAFSLAAILGHLIVGADREQIDVVSWLSALTFAVIAAAGALVFQRLRDRLTTSIDEAERNADARQQFLSNMSHEIRTPLSGVVGLMEILATEPGVGTRFKVALPLPRTTTAPPAAQAAPRVEDSPALRVLVAEDERINALVVERHLKELGHSVTHVWDGYAAVAEYRNGSHDIVLMDAQMPKMDGTEATRLIREHEKSAGGVKQRIPILALTAYATQADHARIRAAEVDDILVKPVSRAELAEAIARHRSSARYRAS
jgi:CheY-like chemotaxis protein